jgi:hypothetical protein
MPIRQVILSSLLCIAVIAFAVFGAIRFGVSNDGLVLLVVLSVLFPCIAIGGLLEWRNKSVDGYEGRPRGVWVVFASFAGAFALYILVGVLLFPWLGFGGFEFLIRWFWLVLPLFTVCFYPFVKRHLL